MHLSEPFMDIHGFEIKPGDTLAVSFPVGSGSELRIGEVDDFTTQKSYYHADGMPVMKMIWNTELSHYAPEKSNVKKDPSRFLLISGSEDFPIVERARFTR